MTPEQDHERLDETVAATAPTMGGLFASAFATSGIAMLLTGPVSSHCAIVAVNSAFLALTGYRADEVIGRNCSFIQGAGTDQAIVERLRQAIRHEQDISVELLNYRKDGTPFWNALFISPVRDGDGQVAYFFGAQVDVTANKEMEVRLQDANARLEEEVERRTVALRAALQAKELLLHEVDHRVKNNLQLVGSLLSVQARRIPDPTLRESLQRALERVSALSVMHHTLYQADDIGRFDVSGFTRRLAQDLMAASGRDDLRLVLELEPFDLPAAKGAPIALILNELLVNALRHGFPDERSGTIRVALVRHDGIVQMLVEDDGAGASAMPPQGGFGTVLVKSLARQLDANLAWESRSQGLRARLLLPSMGESHEHAH